MYADKTINERCNRLMNFLRQVRSAFEQKNIDQSLLCSLYLNYQLVKEIEGFIAHAMAIFPKGCCGLASLYIQHSLQRGTIVQGRYNNEPHTFLLLDNNMIIDITADQFGGPEVHIGPLRDPWKRGNKVTRGWKEFVDSTS